MEKDQINSKTNNSQKYTVGNDNTKEKGIIVSDNESSIPKPFSERHPILNIIIGIFIIIIGIGIAAGVVFYLMKYLLVAISSFIQWITTNGSKIDAVIIVALITGTVSLVSVIISTVVSKTIEYKKNRQEYLAQKREEPYSDFIDVVYKIQQNVKKPGSYGEKQMEEDIAKFSRKITLWGSSSVVNKWVKFRETGNLKIKKNTNILFVMENIMNAMRKDMGLKKVKKGNLLAFFVNDIKKIL